MQCAKFLQVYGVSRKTLITSMNSNKVDRLKGGHLTRHERRATPMTSAERKERDRKALKALADGKPYAVVAAKHGLSVGQLYRRVGKQLAVIKSAEAKPRPSIPGGALMRWPSSV